MNRKQTTARLAVIAALAGLGLAIPGCVQINSTMKVSDLKGWMTVTPNPVAAGQPVTRTSFLYNGHATEWAFIDSTVIDTLHHSMSFNVLPGDTTYAVEEMGLTYPSAGTYIHHLTFYTTVGVIICPPCTVVVQ